MLTELRGTASVKPEKNFRGYCKDQTEQTGPDRAAKTQPNEPSTGPKKQSSKIKAPPNDGKKGEDRAPLKAKAVLILWKTQRTQGGGVKNLRGGRSCPQSSCTRKKLNGVT